MHPQTVLTMPFVYDDGGRAKAGFLGTTGDCVVRAITIASGNCYGDVYAVINHMATQERKRASGKKSSARNGVFKPTYRKMLANMGWKFTPTMTIGSGCRVHLRSGELPMGRLIVVLSKHLCAVVDGVVHDTHDPSRGGSRCVYGYFTRG